MTSTRAMDIGEERRGEERREGKGRGGVVDYPGCADIHTNTQRDREIRKKGRRREESKRER